MKVAGKKVAEERPCSVNEQTVPLRHGSTEARHVKNVRTLSRVFINNILTLFSADLRMFQPFVVCL